MTLPITDETRKELNRYIKATLQLVSDLQNAGRYNPFYVMQINKVSEIMDYSNLCLEHHNDLMKVLFGNKKIEFFADMSKYEIKPEVIDTTYDGVVIHNTFKFYSLLEFGLSTLLHGVPYGKSQTVKGTETLGRLKNIMAELIPTNKFLWDEIDIEFRNALAHGWYYFTSDKMVYFPSSKLETSKHLTREELWQKSHKINLMSIAVVGKLREWDRGLIF